MEVMDEGEEKEKKMGEERVKYIFGPLTLSENWN